MRYGKILSASGLVAAGVVGLAAIAPLAGAGTGEASAEATAAASASASAAAFTVDPVHSGVVFAIDHANAARFHGMFHGLSGSMSIDMDSPQASRFDLTIDTSSVATGNADRDNHLRSTDFFNVQQFPEATFEATGGERVDDDTIRVRGELTLLGVTKPVTAMVTHTGDGQFRGQDRSGFEAVLSFNRSVFGMTKYVAEGVLGDEVELRVFVEGIAQ